MVRCLGFAAPLSEPIGELPGGRLEIHFSDLHLVVDSFVDIFSLQEEEPGFDVPFGNPDGDSFLNGPLNASGISQCVGQPLRSLLNGLLVRIRSDDQGNVLEGSPPIGPDLNGILAVDPLLPGSTTRRERKDSDLLRISSSSRRQCRTNRSRARSSTRIVNRTPLPFGIAQRSSQPLATTSAGRITSSSFHSNG